MSQSTHVKPRPIEVLVANIPDEMKERPQWVVWESERNILGEWTKVPYDARTGRRASTTNPTTWSSFDHAFAAYSDPSCEFAGVGFVFSKDDPYVGIDLDDCRDPESGAILPWTDEQRSCNRWQPDAPEPSDLIKKLGSYAEVSPSERGVKVIIKAELLQSGKAGDFEAYSEKRYFTITGWRLSDAPAEVADCNGQLEALREAFFEGQQKQKQSRQKTTTIKAPGDDELVLARCRSAANGDKFRKLFDKGDSSDYQSQSEADLALCSLLGFWTGPDAARVDRLFRQSALMRPKWDESRGDKTYGEKTVTAALTRQRDYYDWECEVTGTNAPNLWKPEGRTEHANAQRLVAMHGNDVRWCDPWSKWLVWDGRRWNIDKQRLIDARAKGVSRRLWEQVAAATKKGKQNPGSVDEKIFFELIRFAKASSQSRGIASMLTLARSEPGIPILPDALDTDQWLLNCINGTLDLRTGELRQHNRRDYMTKLCPVEFDPSAKCPIWEDFLCVVMDGRQDLIGYLRRLVGYSLTGVVQDHALPYLYGFGANGKSTFLNTILELLGADYAMKAPPELLIAKHGTTHPTELADLFGKRFVAAIEVEDGRRFAESLMKELTGGDKVRARRMREDFWEFSPTHKIWLAANHKLEVRGTDHGIWRRIKLIPFTVVIPDHEQDGKLLEKLKAELPGILNWAVKGSMEWQNQGLGEPEDVRAATDCYKAEMDAVASFIDECCIIGGDYKVAATPLYDAYKDWCDRTGEHPVSQRRFGERLTEKKIGRRRGTGGKFMRFGIGLVAESM